MLHHTVFLLRGEADLSWPWHRIWSSFSQTTEHFPSQSVGAIVPTRPLRENICRLVFVFLRLSSGWLAFCQKFHSEKPEAWVQFMYYFLSCYHSTSESPSNASPGMHAGKRAVGEAGEILPCFHLQQHISQTLKPTAPFPGTQGIVWPHPRWHCNV